MEAPFWSINAGHILTILSMLLSGWTTRRDHTKRLNKLESKVNRIATDCRHCSDIEDPE